MTDERYVIEQELFHCIGTGVNEFFIMIRLDDGSEVRVDLDDADVDTIVDTEMRSFYTDAYTYKYQRNAAKTVGKQYCIPGMEEKKFAAWDREYLQNVEIAEAEKKIREAEKTND